MDRKPSFFEAVSTLVVMTILVFVGFVVFEVRIEPLLIASAIYAGFIGKRVGLTWRDMEKAIGAKVATAMPAILILFSVGIVIGTWTFSGTVPMMIYYGLKIISPKMFLVTAFLLTAIVSTATGTSWGSAGTVGVALIGVAAGIGIPLPQAAGAIVAGSVFGDKLSPLSDTTNLASLVCEVDLYAHIRHMLYTTIPASLIALAIYYVVGMNIESDLIVPETVTMLMDTLDAIFNWNIFLLLPPAIIIFGSIRKYATVPIMLLSSAVALITGVLAHGFSLLEGIQSATSGFHVSMASGLGIDPDTVIWEVSKLLNRGGLKSMSGLVTVIICAYVFASIIERAGVLTVILHSFHEKIKTQGQLVLVTILSSMGLVTASGTSFISIVMIGELFKDTYVKMGLDPKNLSRSLEDAGTMFNCLIPWSSAGVFYIGALGVSPAEFWPWAIPCYVGIAFAIFYGFTGIAIAKLPLKNGFDESA